jgi:GNAT superfamily N-acetyltransferase
MKQNENTTLKAPGTDAREPRVFQIKMFEFGTVELGRKIAAMHGAPEDRWFNVWNLLLDRRNAGEHTGFTFIAENERGECVGTLGCAFQDRQNPLDPPWESHWLCECLFVRKDCRRLGIARRLFGAVLERLVDIGAAFVISSYDKGNEPSRLIHESVGFSHVEDKARYYFSEDPDEILARRELPDVYNLTPFRDSFQMTLVIDACRRESGEELTYDFDADWHQFQEKRFSDMLSEPDTKYYIVRRGVVQIGYVKVVRGAVDTLQVFELARDERVAGAVENALRAFK